MEFIWFTPASHAATFGRSGALTGAVTCFSLKSFDWQNVDSCTVKLHESTARKTESHIRTTTQHTVGPRQHTHILKLHNISSRTNAITAESGYFWPLRSKVNGVAVKNSFTSQLLLMFTNFSHVRDACTATSETTDPPQTRFLLLGVLWLLIKALAK